MLYENPQGQKGKVFIMAKFIKRSLENVEMVEAEIIRYDDTRGYYTEMGLYAQDSSTGLYSIVSRVSKDRKCFFEKAAEPTK